MEYFLLFIFAIAVIWLIKCVINTYLKYREQKFYVSSEIQKNYDRLKEEEINLKQKESDLKQKESEIKRKAQDKERRIKQKEEDINRIINDTTQNASWLVSRFVDYQEILDNKKVEFLSKKKRPAKKAAEVVSEVSKEKRTYYYKAKTLQYQLEFLTQMFPMLEEAMEISSKDLEKISKEISDRTEIKSDYETVKEWLTPEEYIQLSNTEKYQLALDRYLRKHKTAWEIGITYERYIGYIYECKGYNVTFNGAIKGFEDFGRDIIAENDKEILIIQCKYWRKERIIHENHIFQLYGTTILKKIELKYENIKKKIIGILITSSTLSDEAKMVANELGIKIKENENFNKDYPRIKCNINRITKEKIYHLPFDQQYDKIKIDLNSGEKYVATVKEAEKLGFRRAKKHNFHLN